MSLPPWQTNEDVQGMLNGLQDKGADGCVIEGKLKWGIVTGSIIIQKGVTNTKLLNKLLAQLKFIDGKISIVMPAASVHVQPLSTTGAARTTAQPLSHVPAPPHTFTVVGRLS